MERNLRRLKNNKYPMNPTTPEDIIEAYQNPTVFQEFGLDLRAKNRFYIDTVVTKKNDSSFTLFASFPIVEMIKEHISPKDRNYLLDGTFSVTPVGYYQLLIIYIEYMNDIFPVFYVLLSGKTAQLYSEVFEYIEKNVFEMKPARFMCDFETGLRCAIKKCFPFAILNGCWFHYKSAIRRKMLALGLHKMIIENSDAVAIYRMILNLPLLPPLFIHKGYKFIKKEARKRKLDSVFKPLFEYFESFWIELVTSFLIFLWIYFIHSFPKFNFIPINFFYLFENNIE